jgi:hypothetical protein
MATPAAWRRNISLNVCSNGSLLSVTGTPALSGVTLSPSVLALDCGGKTGSGNTPAGGPASNLC